MPTTAPTAAVPDSPRKENAPEGGALLVLGEPLADWLGDGDSDGDGVCGCVCERDDAWEDVSEGAGEDVWVADSSVDEPQ